MYYERGYSITLKDNRNVKVINAEIDGFLQAISETEIIINFQVALTNLYPQLIPIHAFCYERMGRNCRTSILRDGLEDFFLEIRN
jgi:hypothetical protein